MKRRGQAEGRQDQEGGVGGRRRPGRQSLAHTPLDLFPIDANPGTILIAVPGSPVPSEKSLVRQHFKAQPVGDGSLRGSGPEGPRFLMPPSLLTSTTSQG